MKKESNKPWYKVWWIWVIIVFAFFVIVGALRGSRDDDDSSSHHSDKTAKTAKSSSKKTASSKTSKSVAKPVTKKPVAKKTVAKPAAETNTAQAVTLQTGTFKVGRDIKPGRYVIKALSGSGNLSSNGDSDINIILGTTEDDDDQQVTSFTTNLKSGENVKIDDIQSVSFTPTPAKRVFLTTLTPGNWVVGKDIKPGRYVIKAASGSGNISSDDGDINSTLGTSADSDSGQVTQVTADLTNGEVISTDIASINLINK